MGRRLEKRHLGTLHRVLARETKPLGFARGGGGRGEGLRGGDRRRGGGGGEELEADEYSRSDESRSDERGPQPSGVCERVEFE
jgi:hypothetical protein